MRILRGSGLLTTLLFVTVSLAQGQITHGPILGRLSSDGVGVWARTSRPGQFRVVYGESSHPEDQTTAPVTTQLAHDNTGWVHIQGLKANTKYFYRVATGNENDSLGGSFRTLPRAAEYRDPELNPGVSLTSVSSSDAATPRNPGTAAATTHRPSRPCLKNSRTRSISPS